MKEEEIKRVVRKRYGKIAKQDGSCCISVVRILDETHFLIDCMANDPTAKAIIENLKTSYEKIKEIASSVISIKVSGNKPNET
jgi:hypothetical protein